MAAEEPFHIRWMQNEAGTILTDSGDGIYADIAVYAGISATVQASATESPYAVLPSVWT